MPAYRLVDNQALYPVYQPVTIADIRPGSKDLEVDITIERNGEPTIYHLDFSGELTKHLVLPEGKVSVTLSPKSTYAACGSSQNGWITVTDTDIPYKSPYSPDQWMPEITASASLTIRGRVGVNLPGTDYQKAVTIMRYIRDKLTDHLGTPNDAISWLPPIEQFDAAVKGQGRLQCNNLVDIFVYFCAAYGIIARRINLWQGGLWGPDTVRKLGYNLLTAAGHTTAEVFDRETNRWIWIDPMYGYAHAELYDEMDDLGSFKSDPLSLETVQRFLNEARDVYFGALTILNSDGQEVEFNKSVWENYLSPQQTIAYICPREL